MSTGDIGESLVGAYMRHVELCSVVTYNNFFPEQQGEVDIVAIKGTDPRVVYLCEVTTHIDGMDATMPRRLPGKLERLRQFAEQTFPGDTHVFQWWSPYVPVGALTNLFESFVAAWAEEGRSLEFIINQEYTRRITLLVDNARSRSSTTNEPAYRLLQILTHLRGTKPQL